jgi:late competence protein required for DNA uptake (superfamily II DNA/RNA helicase)
MMATAQNAFDFVLVSRVNAFDWSINQTANKNICKMSCSNLSFVYCSWTGLNRSRVRDEGLQRKILKSEQLMGDK